MIVATAMKVASMTFATAVTMVMAMTVMKSRTSATSVAGAAVTPEMD